MATDGTASEGLAPDPALHTHPYPFSAPDQLILDPTYAQLRENEPLARIQTPHGTWCWLVTKQKDARTVLSDPRFSREAVLHIDVPRLRPEKLDEPGTLMTVDAPEHSRLRRLVAVEFTAARVEKMRPRTAELAHQFIDDMVAAGQPADFIELFAFMLPLTVVCELLGIDTEGREIFREGANAVNSISSMTPEARRAAYMGLHAYIGTLVDKRRDNPEDREDLLTALIKVRDSDGDRLSERELVRLAAGILSGGQETTMSQLGNIVWTLQQDRSRWEYLVEDPTRIPNAVEELMRFIALPAAAELPRVATEDVELTSGTIRKGEAVLVNMAAVNRDPAVFDDPEHLHLERGKPKPHLAFGFGPHSCLGNSLARLELQESLKALVERMPNLRIAEGGAKFRTGALVRGLDHLLVTW